MRKKEFIIDDLITLRLINNKTTIFIDGKEFKQCKHLFILNPQNIEQQDNIDSIDEVKSIISPEYKFRLDEVGLTHEEEFWGHCSNLQAWVENNYDTRLIHSNLAFPLLKKIAEKKSSVLIKFREEIVKRLENGFFPTVNYLVEESYIDFLENEDFVYLLNKPRIDYFENIGETQFEDLKNKKNSSIRVDNELLLNKKKFLLDFLNFSLCKNERIILNKLENKLNIKFLIKKYEPVPLGYCIEISKGRISRLCLANYNLKGLLPKEIGELKNLKELNLYRSNLREVPEWLSKLIFLRDLNLGRCNIKALPKSFENLKNLEYLNLKGNNFERFPKALYNLQNLKHLSINRGIKEINAEIGNLKNLKRLELDRNQLKKLPNTIGDLVKLKSLNLMRNKLEYLPNSIGKLNNLIWLDLANNKITNIPETIEDLENIKTIILNKNPLQELPTSILNQQNLKKIQIDKSQKESISNSTLKALEKKIKIVN